MALDSGRSDTAGTDWKSLDQLFCDLIQDPQISALITNSVQTQGESSDVSSALTCLQETDNGSCNWRPWSPVTPDPEGSCVTNGVVSRSNGLSDSGNIFMELAKTRPMSLLACSSGPAGITCELPQDPRVRSAATPTDSPASTPRTATPQSPPPTTPLAHQHPYLNDPRTLQQRPSNFSFALETQPHESTSSTPTPTTSPYQNGYHQQPMNPFYVAVPTLNQFDQNHGHGIGGSTAPSLCSMYRSAPPSAPSPQTPPASVPHPTFPLSPSEYDYSQLVDVEVTLRADKYDAQLYGRRGVVLKVSASPHYSSRAVVAVCDTHQEVTIPCGFLQVLCPRPQDIVKVISGINKGSLGRLMTVTNSTGIVQLFTNGGHAVTNLIQFGLKELGRYSPRGSPGLLSRGGSLQNGFVQNSWASSPFVVTDRLYHYRNGYPAYHPRPMSTRGRNGFSTTSTSNPFYTRLPPPYPQGKLPNSPMKADSLLKSQKLHPQRIAVDRAVVDKSLDELLRGLLKKSSPTYNYSGTDDGSEIKTSCVRVSLVCPLSQRRMEYPCRGLHCRHPQCFDARAYLEFNRTQRGRCKVKSGILKQAVTDRRWNCPLCHKVTPYNHLYLDRTLMSVVKETSVTEVEFDQSGSWKPVERAEAPKENVIDLTLDDSDSED